MEKFEPKIHKEKKEETSKAAKPPENLPIEGIANEVEIEIDISDFDKNRKNFETDRKILDTYIESGDESFVRDAMEWSEYCGASPDFSSDLRRLYKQYAERARKILESKRDISLSSFDEKKELKKMRARRKQVVEWVKDGNMTREKGLEISRKEFEQFKKERDWQRNGLEYFQTKIMEDIFREMKTSAGVSALEGRMILENKEEFEDYISENGREAAIKLLEVVPGYFQKTENRADFFDAVSEEIKKRGKSYRFTDEQIEWLENSVYGGLMARHNMVFRDKEKYKESELFEKVSGRSGTDKYENEAIATPFVFCLRAANLKDYAALYHQKESNLLSEDEIKKAGKSGGFYSFGKYYVVLKNTEYEHFDRGQFEVFTHEEQHFCDGIFQKSTKYGQFSTCLEKASAVLGETKIKLEKEDSDKIQREIGRALRGFGEKYKDIGFRKYYEWRAASEFLAYFKEDMYPVEQILGILIKEKQRGGLYDYFDEETREEIFRYITENFEGIDKSETRKIIQKILVEEYEKMLGDAAKAMIFLEEAKISKNHIINFLQKLPLGRWLPETKKLLKMKRLR